LVVTFHGYTACPQAYNGAAAELQAACFDVLSPLSPGHGRIQCTVEDGYNCVNGSDISALPTSKDGYLVYVESINAAAEQFLDGRLEAVEKTREDVTVGAMGLSLGSPLSAHAVASSSMYTNLLVLSPFFGVTVPDLDFLIADTCIHLGGRDLVFCLIETLELQGAEAYLLRALLNSPDFQPFIDALEAAGTFYLEMMAFIQILFEQISNNPQLSIFDGLRDAVIGWGEKCLDDRENYGRGGICNFRGEHILAAHALARHTSAEFTRISLSRSAAGNSLTGLRMQTAAVQRDGSSRNGLAWILAQAVDRAGESSACVYMLGCEDRATNNCGVPHSALAVEDNIGTEPGNLWWAEGMIGNITQFFVSDEAFGDNTWDRSERNVCFQQPIRHASPTLVSSWPRLALLTVATSSSAPSQGDGPSEMQRDDIMDGLAAAVNEPRRAILPIPAELQDPPVDEDELLLLLPADAMFSLSIFDSSVPIGSSEYTIEEVKVDATDDGGLIFEASVYDGSSNDGSAWKIAVAAVGGVVVAVPITLLAKFQWDKKKKQYDTFDDTVTKS
jgi:hypothetical protein